MDTYTHTENVAKESRKGRAKRRPRRLRPISEKRLIVEETFQPGESVSTVARRHEVNANLVFNWRKLYQQGLLEVPASMTPTLIPVKVSADATIVAAGVTVSRDPVPLTPVRSRSEAGSIEIELSGGRFIRVNGKVDRTTLSRVIHAVARR